MGAHKLQDWTLTHHPPAYSPVIDIIVQMCIFSQPGQAVILAPRFKCQNFLTYLFVLRLHRFDSLHICCGVRDLDDKSNQCSLNVT